MTPISTSTAQAKPALSEPPPASPGGGQGEGARQHQGKRRLGRAGEQTGEAQIAFGLGMEAGQGGEGAADMFAVRPRDGIEQQQGRVAIGEGHFAFAAKPS